MTARERATSEGRVFSIIGIVLAIPALLLFPPVFGALGVAFGVIGHVKGDPLGKWAIGVAVVLALIGMALGIWVMNQT